MANQVFLQCGLQKFGPPATWDKARKAVRVSLGNILGREIAEEIQIVEGAGLSRNNTVTAMAMLRVLEVFYPYKELMQERKDSALKSGTLDGVYNYAGYLDKDRLFVILLNQKDNKRDAVLQRLDRVMEKEKHQ